MINNLSSFAGVIVRAYTVVVMTMFIIPLLVLYLFAHQIGFTEESYSPIAALGASIVVGLPSIAAFLLASNSVVYFCVIAIGVFCGLYSIFGPKQFIATKILALLIIIILCIFLAIPYKTVVQPADGYRITSPTQPTVWQNGLRNLQVLGEVTPCAYQLMGWKERYLFFEKTCNGLAENFQFNPQTKNIVHTTNFVSDEDIYIDKRKHTEILTRFQGYEVNSSDAQQSAIELSLRGDAFISPNAEWIAVVTRHIYGPEDIIVVTTDSNR